LRNYPDRIKILNIPAFYYIDSAVDDYNAPQTKTSFIPMPFVRARESPKANTTIPSTTMPLGTDNEEDEDDVTHLLPHFIKSY
jgi:hypothetical protein